MKIVIFPYNDTIAVVYEVEWEPIQQTAIRVTPHGLPFLIGDDTDLPSDRSTREAWQADFSAPDGIGIGPQRWHIAQCASVIADPNSTPEQIEAAMQLSEQMQREIIQIEGAPM